MESKTSSGQILIECAILLVFLALLFHELLDFNAPKDRKGKRYRENPSRQQIIKNKQVHDFSGFRNGDR